MVFYVSFVRVYLLSRAAFRYESIKELKYIKWSMILINLGICILYFYMFYSLPGSFLWVSRVTDYVIYESLKMRKYYGIMRLIPCLILLFIIALCYSLFRYEKELNK